MTPIASRSVATRWDSLPIPEIDILWMTAGLGCDGDTIAVTAATQPSLEDIVLGALPWIPKVNFHNPFLAYENGDEFVRHFCDAAEGKLSPFILVVSRSDDWSAPEKRSDTGTFVLLGLRRRTMAPALGEYDPEFSHAGHRRIHRHRESRERAPRYFPRPTGLPD